MAPLSVHTVILRKSVKVIRKCFVSFIVNYPVGTLDTVVLMPSPRDIRAKITLQLTTCMQKRINATVRHILLPKWIS